MFRPHYVTSPRALYLGIFLSLLFHALFLLLQPLQQTGKETRTAPLQARLAAARPPASPTAATRPPPPPAPVKARQPRPATQEARTRILTARKDTAPRIRNEPAPTWSVAEKKEMNDFLNGLASENRKQPKPDLAERSMAMAREIARESMRETPERASEGRSQRRRDPSDMIERIPDSPPVDAFSLEFYLDALVKKLNRSASFVKNDPRNRGIHNAAVEVRLNPDGSLKSFKVINAADQQDEIAFVRSVVERAVPFAAFPPDIGRSARSLALMICIQPTGLGGDGLGFSRRPEGGRC